MKINNLLTYFAILLIMNACASTENKDRSTISNIFTGIKGEPVIPRSANRIYIEIIKSRNSKNEISEKLILEIKKNINMDGRLTVVSKDENPDLLLKGKVISYNIQALEYGNLGTPVKKRMRIITTVQLIDTKRKGTIFFEKGIQSFKIFSDVIPPIETKEYILKIIIDDLAKRIFSKTITGWYTDRMTDIEKGKK